MRWVPFARAIIIIFFDYNNYITIMQVHIHPGAHLSDPFA